MAIDGVGGIGFFRETVFQDKRCDPMIRQPLSDIVAFVGDTENPMSSARRDDDGGPICLVVGGEKWRDGRLVDLGDF